MGRTRRAKQARPPATVPAGSGSSRRWIVAAVAVVLVGSGAALLRPWGGAPESPAAGSTPRFAEVPGVPAAPARRAAAVQAPRRLRVEVLRALSHERDAYTQGLLWWNGQLFESTGREGESTLRRIDPETGAVVQRVDIPAQYFGEGLARVDERFIMLTWRGERAFVFDRDSFAELDTYRYRGEGWGLCYDGDRLVMSDGSDLLTFRDPATFEPTGERRVQMDGRPLSRLNELECVGDAVYANVWEEDYIVRIDPDTGQVTEHIDAAGLLSGDDLVGAEVLNGIAYDPEADTFYITGKWWPKMFEVRFVEK